MATLKTIDGLMMNWFRRKVLDLKTNRFIKRRRRAFEAHLLTLEASERKQIIEGAHPSQSHDRAHLTEPIIELLNAELKKLGYPATVKVSFGQMNRIVLSAKLIVAPKRLKRLPRFYRGYEVYYHWPGAVSGKLYASS